MPGDRVWTDGEVVTGSLMNSYLQRQVNLIVPDTGSVVSSLTEGMVVKSTDDNREYTYAGGGWVRTGWYFSTGRTGFIIERGSTQSITQGGLTAITWTNESLDTDGFISVSSTTATVPAGCGGLYAISLNINVANPATAGAFTNGFGGYSKILAGGEVQQGSVHGCSFIQPLAESHTISAQIQVDTTQNITARMTAFRLGP